MRAIKRLILISAIIFALIPGAALADPGQSIPQPGLRCNVNWGDQPTYTTADNGCKYEGKPQLGGIPDGWYANTASGNVWGAVFTASVLTLRPGNDGVVPLHPEGGVAPVAIAQASAPVVDIPPEGMRCNINFGTALTKTTADNGCAYKGPKVWGGIPEGWSADTPMGKVTGFVVIEAEVLTLRRTDGSAVPVLPDTATAPAMPSAAAPAPAMTTRVIVCPKTNLDVAREFGVPETQVGLVGPYFTLFSGEPGGKTWTYNKTEDGKLRDGPTLEFAVPVNWTVDHPGGDAAKTGTPVKASVLTARCGQ